MKIMSIHNTALLSIPINRKRSPTIMVTNMLVFKAVIVGLLAFILTNSTLNTIMRMVIPRAPPVVWSKATVISATFSASVMFV